MPYDDNDPAVKWSHLLSRLDGPTREVAIDSLRYSASTGSPASEQAVRLLVDYACGEISSSEYTAGMLVELGFRSPDSVLSSGLSPVSPRVRRRDAVNAYMTGQIPVNEFLRIARA